MTSRRATSRGVDEGGGGDRDRHHGLAGEGPRAGRGRDGHDHQEGDQSDELGLGRQAGERAADGGVGAGRRGGRCSCGRLRRHGRPATRSGRRRWTTRTTRPVRTPSTTATTRWPAPRAVATAPGGHHVGAADGELERRPRRRRPGWPGRRPARPRPAAGERGRRGQRRGRRVQATRAGTTPLLTHVEADGGDAPVGQDQGLDDDHHRHAHDGQVGPDQHRGQAGADQVGAGAEPEGDDQQLGHQQVGGDDGRRGGGLLLQVRPRPGGRTRPPRRRPRPAAAADVGRSIQPSGMCTALAGPITTVAGGGRRWSPRCSRVVWTTRAPGRVAAWTTAAGVAGSRPAATRASARCRWRARPTRTTSEPSGSARAAEVGGGVHGVVVAGEDRDGAAPGHAGGEGGGGGGGHARA